MYWIPVQEMVMVLKHCAEVGFTLPWLTVPFVGQSNVLGRMMALAVMRMITFQRGSRRS